MSAADKAAKTEAEAKISFPGVSSDGDAGILGAGIGEAATALLVFKEKVGDPAAEIAYSRWHLFDHMPEQFRVAGVRNGQRWVSTPDCRAARFAEAAPYERADYVVQYLFAEPAPQAIATFAGLGKALHAAGRKPPSKQAILGSSGYDVVDMRANPRGPLGAYALPWYPATGIFLTVESTTAADPDALARLVDVEGVAGAWRYVGAGRDLSPVKTNPQQSATVFYLYDDPVVVAERLKGVVERDWSRSGALGLLAEPFYVVRPLDLGLRLP